ncbi:alpha/beta fold hydrolase [Oceanobacter kriegii]|uniref:alpha/beta fold hydrolase n=1 Tax=Oceanobacter kriegii TaxID=64972 RepID=UPI000400F409|nr:alpha/beta fold hydrolase [Oceanobacter kriegii]
MSALKLNYQITGEGKPLVIIHGLFGMLQNWGAQTKALSEEYQVITVDLRNHGRSPHSDDVSYPAMAADVRQLIADLGFEKVDLLGHSMGGKVAMQLACEPDTPIERLILADIAPVDYPNHHSDVFAGLQAVDLATLKSRGEADKIMAEHIDDASVRAFLLTNLYKNEGQFAWRINLKALVEHYDEISCAPAMQQPYEGPTLFIKGGDSHYILPKYQDAVLKWFPNAGYKVMPNVGHWLHAEKPDLFTSLVRRFLQG